MSAPDEFNTIMLNILSAEVSDGAKVAAVAMMIVGQKTARELAEICNAKLRTMERHAQDARQLIRRFAGETEEPLRAGAEEIRKSAEYPTQICVSEQDADSRAGATKELPSVINNTLEREGEVNPLDRDVPHMNGKGYIISAKHDLYIPAATISKWRMKYTALPDLEDTISGLAAHILSKGHMHAGWQCPEGWMPKLLAEENAKAENIAREAKAREKRAGGIDKQSEKQAKDLAFLEMLRAQSGAGAQ